MNGKRILIGIVAAGAALSVGSIGYAVINGKYLEAIAVSGVVSTLAWFMLQGKDRRREEIVERDEQVEEREG